MCKVSDFYGMVNQACLRIILRNFDTSRLNFWRTFPAFPWTLKSCKSNVLWDNLSFSYDNYNMTSQILSQKDISKWSLLKVRILDSPIQPHLKFSDRYQFLQNYIETHPEFSKLKIASYEECKSQDHVNQLFKENANGVL